MLNILVVGASGNTGKLLVQQLLDKGNKVKIVVRNTAKVSLDIRNNENCIVLENNILEMENNEIKTQLDGIDVVASCLGHNMNLKGMFFPPRRLVTDTARKLCNAVIENKPKKPVKYLLMSSSGIVNDSLNEKVSFGHKIIVFLIRHLIPPHKDNEKAFEFLSKEIGQNHQYIEWATVRPDTLIDNDSVTEYETHPSPIRDGIFDPGKSSRINVAHFMANLCTNDDIWNIWKGQSPLLYNLE